MLTNISFAAETNLAQQMFDQAMEKRESGDVFAAIEIFESLLAKNPGLNRARLELAVAYHQANRYKASMNELQTVLDDPNTPENVRLSILAYLGQVSKDEKKPEGSHQLSYYLKAGLLHNSNLNASQAVATALGPSSTSEISSIGTDIVASIGHRYSRKKLLDITSSVTQFEWQSQATLNSNIYEQNNDFNLNVVSLSTGPAFISPGSWRASIFMRADYIALGDNTLAVFASINPNITFDLGGFHNVLVESSFTTHDYDAAENAEYDGNESMLGVGYTLYLPKYNAGLEAGFKLHQNNADSKAFSYDLNEFYSAGFIALDEQSNVYLKLHTRSYDYKAIDTTLNINGVRDDTENQITIGINYDPTETSFKGWTLNIELSAIDNDSNADSLDYERNIFTINWSKYFQ